MDHDGGYHLLFSHPRMVADLLAGFVDQPWVAELDLASLERVNAKFHAEGLERRDGDVIWKIRRHDGRFAYLYLLIEFQSTCDRWMALRVAVYVLLLYLHLIREDRLAPEDRLPPVYPLVLFNGESPWTAKHELCDLIAPGPDGHPWPWAPRFHYLLLDEQRYNPARLQGMSNLVAVLFQLEQCRTVAELGAQIERMIALLQEPANASLFRAFLTLVFAVLAPARGLALTPGDMDKMVEDPNMLAERVRKWEQDLLEQGIHQGVHQGLRQGRAEGEALALIRVAERRFGPLPAPLKERIMAADTGLVETWLDRVMTAPSRDAVFTECSLN